MVLKSANRVIPTTGGPDKVSDDIINYLNKSSEDSNM